MKKVDATNSRIIRKILLCAVVIFGISLHTAHARDTTYQPSRVDFKISANGIITNLSLVSVFVLPGESIKISADTTAGYQTITVVASDGELIDNKTQWTWKAPAAYGSYDLKISHQNHAEQITLRVFVMYPISEVKNSRLNGYLIGQYPKKPYKNLPQYKAPRGFIEVTKENASLRVTPHFTLSQFVCKQNSGYPKYIVLRELLLLKLELILDKVNEAGYACNTFNVLSGYRTPSYNNSIGNVKYSRHQWGGAVDIFIDENPPDGMMDDLNKDNRIDWKDAAVLYELIDNMYGSDFYKRFIGGLGQYKKNNNHGPFVHVDVRGFRARWSD